MDTMNIGDSKDDPFYRYKMPRLQTKIEGRGNGIKTIIINMVDIAKAISRDAAYVTKYFGCELGAQSKFDIKNDKAIVNGNHDQDKLIQLLVDFIKKFVLCGRCGNPETVYSIDKKDNITMKCKACSHITHIDPREKLCTYILNHPPEGARKAKEKKEKDDIDNEAGASNDVQEDVQDTEVVEVKEKKPKKKKEETVEEEEQADVEEINPSDLLMQFVEKKPDATESQINKAIQKICDDYELSYKDVVLMIFETFLNDKNIIKSISERKSLLSKYVTGEDEQKVLIGCIERLCGETEASLLKASPNILKTFYDEDLLEEEVIIDWFESKKRSKFVGKEVTKKFKEAVKVFVEWLQNAEEDDSEEEN